MSEIDYQKLSDYGFYYSRFTSAKKDLEEMNENVASDLHCGEYPTNYIYKINGICKALSSSDKLFKEYNVNFYKDSFRDAIRSEVVFILECDKKSDKQYINNLLITNDYLKIGWDSSSIQKLDDIIKEIPVCGPDDTFFMGLLECLYKACSVPIRNERPIGEKFDLFNKLIVSLKDMIETRLGIITNVLNSFKSNLIDEIE